jgi:hypothetical protein
MHESGGGGLTKKARGFRGKEAVNGGCSVEGERFSWMDIMARPARAKHPAPILTFADRHSDIRRDEAVGESDAETWPQDIGGRVEWL